jgi:hypothetical protein
VPAVPETKATWTNGVDALDSTNLHAYIRDPLLFLMRRPMAVLRRTTAQTIANDTWTAVSWNAEEVDDDPDGIGGHSTSSNPARYTARYPGWYLCAGSCVWENNSSGRRQARWARNGSAIVSSEVALAAEARSSSVWPTRLIYLDEGDYLEAQVNQSSGGSLDLTAISTTALPQISVVWQRLEVPA